MSKLVSNKSLTDEIIDYLKTVKKPVLVDKISLNVTKTSHHCRIRKTMIELEDKGVVMMMSDGWVFNKRYELDEKKIA